MLKREIGFFSRFGISFTLANNPIAEAKRRGERKFFSGCNQFLKKIKKNGAKALAFCFVLNPGSRNSETQNRGVRE